MPRYRIAMMAAVWLVPLHASADPKLEDQAEHLSLDQVFAVAVRVAPQLQNAAFDIAVARGNRQNLGGIENWDLGLDLQRLTVVNTGAISTVDNTFTTSLSKLLPTNGTLSLSTSVAQSETQTNAAQGNGMVLLPGTNSNVTVGVTYKQPLLANRGEVVEKSLIWQADHQLAATTIRRSATARVFAASVIAAYWRLALAWRTLDVRRVSLQQADSQLAAAKRGLKTGAIAESEVYPFEQSFAARQADIAGAEHDIITQSIAFRTLVGLDVSPTAIAIRTEDLPPADVTPLELDSIVARTLATSDDLKAAVEDIRAADAINAAAMRNLDPKLDLTLGGNRSGNNIADGLHDYSASGVGNAWTSHADYTVSAELTFDLPFGRDAVRGAHAVARANLARATFNLLADRRTVMANVIQLVADARSAGIASHWADAEIKVAIKNVDAEQHKFEVGKATANDVVLRQTELEAARLQLENSNADYIVARTQIEAATGEILAHHGIKMLDVELVTGAALAGSSSAK